AEPGPEPDRAEDQAEEERDWVLQPARGERLNPDEIEKARYDADIAVVELEHQDPANDERGHHPDEDRRLDPRGTLHVSEDEGERAVDRRASPPGARGVEGARSPARALFVSLRWHLRLNGG